MLNMNNCQICGNLVRDPEIKNTSSGESGSNDDGGG